MNKNNNVYGLSKAEINIIRKELKRVIKQHSKNRNLRPKRPIETQGQQ